MPGITTTWDVAVPLGSEDPKNGDNRIRDLKLSLSEIFRNGGHRLLAGPSTNALLGRHVCSEEFASGGTSALIGEFYIYANDGTTKLVTVGDSTAATASQVTIAAGILLRCLGTFRVTNSGTFDGAVTVGTTLAVTGVTTHSDVVKPNANNTIDLGIDVTNAWRDLFVGRNAKIGGTLNVTGIATFVATPVFSAGLGTISITTSSLTINGGQSGLVTTTPTTGTLNVAANDRMIIIKLTGDVTVNLPAVASNIGRELWIKRDINTAAATSEITIDANGAETIDGAPTVLLDSGSGQINGVHLVGTADGWAILSRVYEP